MRTIERASRAGRLSMRVGLVVVAGLVGGVGGSGGEAWADDPPYALGHEGLLIDADGLPMEGEHQLTFTIWDAPEGGEVVWEANRRILVDAGYYSVQLGEDAPLGGAFSGTGPKYLGIAVDDGFELEPRRPLGTVGYALNAIGHISPRSITVAGEVMVDEDGNVPGILAAIRTADGPGSRLDADRIDGIDSSQILYAGNAAAPVILRSMLQAMGAEGLDADTVDGLHAHTFMRVDEDTGTAGNLVVAGDLTVGGATAAEKLILQPQEEPPSEPAVGTVYMADETRKLRLWDGRKWVDLDGGGSGGSGGRQVGNDPSEPRFPDAEHRRNCSEILRVGESRGSGTYTVDPDGDGQGVFDVYCDMETDDGGWTSVGQYKHPGYSNAPGDHDNRDYAYFMRARTNTAYGRPEYYGNLNSAGPWTDWRVLEGMDFPIEFVVLMDMNSFSPNWDAYPRKAIYQVSARDVMPNFGTSQNLVGGLMYRLNSAADWVDVGSSSASGHYYWYPYDSSNRYLTLFHVSNYNYIDGRSPTNYHYSNYYGTGVPGGNNSWHHGNRMLVRESSEGAGAGANLVLHDAPIKRSCKEILQTGGNEGDGLYLVDPSGEEDEEQAFTVYCDMITDGGGWTVLGHYKHPAHTNGPEGHDNRDYALYMQSRAGTTYGREDYIGNPDSNGPWTDWRPLAGMQFPAEFAVILDMNKFRTNWDGYPKKVIYKIAHKDYLPNFGTSQELRGGNVQYRFSTATEWTDVGSSSASGHYYWYPYDSSNRYLTLFHVSNYNYIDRRSPTNYHYNNYFGAGVPGGNNSWHHGSRILIRESDPIEREELEVVDAPIGRNCKEIMARGDSAGDGVYRIDPTGQQSDAIAFAAYCDMTTDGGGWTAVGHYRHPLTTQAPQDHDNRDYAYYMRARRNEFYGRAEFQANPNSDGPWTDWRVLQGVDWPIEFAVLLDQERFTTRWNTYGKKTIYRVKNRNTMPNYGTSQDLRTSDNLYYKLEPGDAWTDVGGSSASGHYYWYPYDSSNRYLTLFHVSNYTYIDGRSPTNYHYANYYGQGVRGGNNSWHHANRMLIR